jgi:flagellar hook assembly protein FlgD
VKLSYSVPSPGRVSVRILDPTGRVVRELFSGTMSRTAGSASWDGRDDMGRAMPAGSYFGYLQTERSGISRKFILTE